MIEITRRDYELLLNEILNRKDLREIVGLIPKKYIYGLILLDISKGSKSLNSRIIKEFALKNKIGEQFIIDQAKSVISIIKPNLTDEDYYKVLESTPELTNEELRQNWLKLMKLYHPDKVGEWGLEKTKKINEAYNFLRNPEKRRDYDSAYYPDIPVKVTVAGDKKFLNTAFISVLIIIILISLAYNYKISEIYQPAEHEDTDRDFPDYNSKYIDNSTGKKNNDSNNYDTAIQNPGTLNVIVDSEPQQSHFLKSVKSTGAIQKLPMQKKLEDVKSDKDKAVDFINNKNEFGKLNSSRNKILKHRQSQENEKVTGDIIFNNDEKGVTVSEDNLQKFSDDTEDSTKTDAVHVSELKIHTEDEKQDSNEKEIAGNGHISDREVSHKTGVKQLNARDKSDKDNNKTLSAVNNATINAGISALSGNKTINTIDDESKEIQTGSVYNDVQKQEYLQIANYFKPDNTPDKSSVYLIISDYIVAYKNRDMNKLQSLFSNKAKENGKSIDHVLDLYKENFDSFNIIAYDIKFDKVDFNTNYASVNGDFIITYKSKSNDSYRKSYGDIYWNLSRVNNNWLIDEIKYEISKTD